MTSDEPLPATPFDAHACPRCGDLVGVVIRHTWRSAARAAAMFGALAVLWVVLLWSNFPHLVIAFLAVAVVSALVAAFVYAVTAPFARNRCKACGNRWR